MKVLFTYDYKDKLDLVRDLGYEVHYCPETEVHHYEALAEMDLLVCYDPFKKLALSQMPKLKGILLSSIGIDQLPKSDVLERGLFITNNKGGYSPAIAEWIVFRILEIYKLGRLFARQQDQKQWKLQGSVEEISDKTICFIGAGSIATQTVKLLKGFGSTLWAVNASGRTVEGFDETFPISELDQKLPFVDTLVITVPYTENTHHLISAERLAYLKHDSVLINVSRGKIIDESALMKSLELGFFKGVALDVFEEEPLPESHPLWQFKQVYISPHNSWVSQYRNHRRFETLFGNLEAFIQNKPLITPVDVKRGY